MTADRESDAPPKPSGARPEEPPAVSPAASDVKAAPAHGRPAAPEVLDESPAMALEGLDAIDLASEEAAQVEVSVDEGFAGLDDTHPGLGPGGAWGDAATRPMLHPTGSPSSGPRRGAVDTDPAMAPIGGPSGVGRDTEPLISRAEILSSFEGDDDVPDAVRLVPPPMPVGDDTRRTDPAMSFESPQLLRRQLEAARSENQALLRQLQTLETARTEALAANQRVLILQARFCNLESELDLERELTGEARARAASLEEALRRARGEGGEGDAETQILQQELESVLAEAEGLREEVERLRGLETTGAEDPEAARAREELERRVEELEAALAEARSRAESREDEERARHAELASAISKAEGERDEAVARGERLKVALERLKTAFVRATEGGRDKDGLVEEARIAAEEAQRERARADDAERALAEARERADRAERIVEELRAADELRAAAEAAAPGVDPEVLRALEDEKSALASQVELARRQIESLEEKVLRLQNELTEKAIALEKAEKAEPRNQDALDRLRAQVRAGSAQIQAYLLELEGSKGSIARSRQEVKRYSRSVNGLAEGIGHLQRYLANPTGDPQHALTLVQEVKRRAAEIRALVESNERFGQSMDQTMDRLTAILQTGQTGHAGPTGPAAGSR